MAHLRFVSPKKRSTLAYTRRQLIFYMGKVVTESPSGLGPLKKIVSSEEFEGLLLLLSGVGTPRMIKLLESASRNCAAKKAEAAKKKKAMKVANALNYKAGSTKRAKLQEAGRSTNHAKDTAYDESRGSRQLLAYSENSHIQRLSEEGQIPSGLHTRNRTRRHRLGLSSSNLTRNAEDEDGTMLASGFDTAMLRHSGPFSHSDNNSRARVKTEYKDSSSKSPERSSNSIQNPGQVEGEQIHTGKRPQSAHESGCKTIIMGPSNPYEVPGAKEKAIHLHAWDMCEREVGIMRRDPRIIAPIEHHCCKAQGDEWDCHSGNPKKELADLLDTIGQLDFLFAKDRLVRYLNNRQATMGIQLAIPATWTMSEPQHVLGALSTLGTICDDAQIHRAFGQMRLYLLVHQKLESGHKPVQSGKGKLRLPAKIYLEELARREAGPVSEEEIEARFHDYHSEYQAGRRWLEVADWFGGPGIVLVFITAGIGPFHVAAGWKLFQRHCLKYISQSLCSIKGLVGALGTDCLEDYCRYGQLSQKHIKKVVEYEGIIPLEEIDADDSEMEVTEEDASGDEVHDANIVEDGSQISDSDEVHDANVVEDGSQTSDSDVVHDGNEVEDSSQTSDSEEESGSEDTSEYSEDDYSPEEDDGMEE